VLIVTHAEALLSESPSDDLKIAATGIADAIRLWSDGRSSMDPYREQPAMPFHIVLQEEAHVHPSILTRLNDMIPDVRELSTSQDGTFGRGRPRGE